MRPLKVLLPTRPLKVFLLGWVAIAVVLVTPVQLPRPDDGTASREEVVMATLARAVVSGDGPTLAAARGLVVEGSPASRYLEMARARLDSALNNGRLPSAGWVKAASGEDLDLCGQNGVCTRLSEFISDASGRIATFRLAGEPLEELVSADPDTGPAPSEPSTPTSEAPPSTDVDPADGSTVPVPETTVPSPVTTVPVPETTVPGPVTTVPVPETTVPGPVTSLPAPPAPVTTTTTAPVTTTTTVAPPAPVEDPRAGGTYGGGPSGVLAQYVGPVVIDKPTTLTDVVITGRLEIRAPVTMRNIRLTCATDWACIRVMPSGSLDISDFEIIGPRQAGPQNSGGIIGDDVVARRGEITGLENGVVAGSNVLLEDLYIHGLQYMFRDPTSPGHPDGVQLDGGQQGVTLRRLRIEGVPTDTSGIMVGTTDGPISQLVVEDCQVSGAGVLMYLETRKTGLPIQATITGSRFDNPAYTGMYVWNTIPSNVDLTQSNNLADGRPATF